MTAATRHNSPGSNSGTVACRDRHRSLPINKRTAPPRHPAVPTPRPTPPALLASSRGGHSARSGPGIAATSAPTSHALGVVCLWYDNRRQDDRIMAYYPVHHTAMLGEQPGNGCTAVRDSGTLSGTSVEEAVVKARGPRKPYAIHGLTRRPVGTVGDLRVAGRRCPAATCSPEPPSGAARALANKWVNAWPAIWPVTGCQPACR